MKWKKPVFVVCLVLAGMVVGYLLGAGYSGYLVKKYIMGGNAGLLSQHILYLAMIRTGDVNGAITDIEKTFDNSIIQLASGGMDRQGHFHHDRIPFLHLLALQKARVYADAGHRQAFSNESLTILDQVSPPQGEFCHPALRALQEQASSSQ